MAERLKLQKIVYLLQAYGMQLGYGYIWYKYGPYSHDLVSDAYAVLNSEKGRYKEKTKGWEFGESTKRKFEEFEKKLGDILDDAGRLELLASVHYLYSHKKTDVSENEHEFVEAFKKRKPKLFDGREIDEGLIKETLHQARQLQAN
jgi:uncharacterized protein YwgA